MAIAYVSGSSNTTSVSTPTATVSITVTAPATITAGNMLFAMMHVGTQPNSAGTAVTFTSTGWNLEATNTNLYATGGAGQLGILSKVATSSEPTSYTINCTITGGTISNFTSALVVQYSGVDTTTPFDASSLTNSGFSTTTSAIAPSVTATQIGTMVVVYATQNGTAITNPSGFTSRQAPSISTSASMWSDKAMTASGATGTTAATLASSTQWKAGTVVLTAAGGGGGGGSNGTAVASASFAWLLPNNPENNP